jgi:hypothetical protein
MRTVSLAARSLHCPANVRYVAVNSVLPWTPSGQYRPQEPSIASSPEDTRLAICQFEFGVRTRIKVRDRQMKRLKYGFRTDFSHQTNSTGVTQTEDLKLPRKLPRRCLDPLDPRRSLATTVCRPIRVRHPYFFGIWLNCRPSPIVTDRPRPSQISGPARTRLIRSSP